MSTTSRSVKSCLSKINEGDFVYWFEDDSGGFARVLEKSDYIKFRTYSFKTKRVYTTELNADYSGYDIVCVRLATPLEIVLYKLKDKLKDELCV
jgi:hypothetical protein